MSGYKISNKFQKKSESVEETVGGLRALLPCLICIICIIIATIAVIRIAVIQTDYRVAESEYDELYDTMPFRGSKTYSVAARTVYERGRKDKPNTDHVYVRADPMEVAFRLNEISHSYKDVIAWIDFESIPISYPLLHGETNDKYVRTTFKGTKATAGSIFMESLNSADFSDQHTIIYGHNMKNETMFGQLKKYESEEFLEENKYFTIYTPQEDAIQYEIISCMVVPVDSFAYRISFEDDSDYWNFLQLLGYEGEDTPQSITLSTCAGSDKAYRLVVNAVRIEEN